MEQFDTFFGNFVCYFFTQKSKRDDIESLFFIPLISILKCSSKITVIKNEIVWETQAESNDKWFAISSKMFS